MPLPPGAAIKQEEQEGKKEVTRDRLQRLREGGRRRNFFHSKATFQNKQKLQFNPGEGGRKRRY